MHPLDWTLLSLAVNVHVPWTSAYSLQISIMRRVKANNKNTYIF